MAAARESTPKVAVQNHMGREPSEWPPAPVSNRRPKAISIPDISEEVVRRAEKTKSLLTSVWGVILVISAAFGGGWAARQFQSDYVRSADLATIRADIALIKTSVDGVNGKVNTVQNDIEWLKRVSAEPKPLVQR